MSKSILYFETVFNNVFVRRSWLSFYPYNKCLKALFTFKCKTVQVPLTLVSLSSKTHLLGKYYRNELGQTHLSHITAQL